MSETKDGYGKRDVEGARCPLFRAFKDNSIRCESHVPDSNTVVICYKSQKKCEKQKKLYCEGNYEKCEHYLSYLQWNCSEE